MCVPLCGGSDATALARTAAVVRQRRDVLDRLDVEPRLLQGADGRLAAGPGALDADLDLFDAELRRLLRGPLGRALRGERRALTRALVSDGAGARPTEGVALRVGDRDDRVVEG